MSFPFSSSPKREYGCSVLVCENGVSLVIYEKLAQNQAKVFYAKNLHMPHQKKGTSRQLGSLISSSVYHLLHDFEQEMRKKERFDVTLSNISFFYAPPLSFAATEEVESQNEKTAELNEQVLASLLKSAEESFIGRFKEVGVRADDVSARYSVIERRIANPKLEGYPVSEYLERPFNHFSALVSFAAVPSFLVKKLTDVCHSIFRNSSVYHKSVMYSVLDDISSSESGQVLLLGALLPDNSVLAYSKHAAPLSHSVFDGGEEHLVAHVAHTLSVTKSVVHSYVTLYREKKLHGESETRFANALDSAREFWAKSMVTAYQTMSELFMLPKTITLIPSGGLSEIVFTKAVTSDDSQSYLINTVGKEHYPNIGCIEHLTISPLEALLINRSLAHSKS